MATFEWNRNHGFDAFISSPAGNVMDNSIVVGFEGSTVIKAFVDADFSPFELTNVGTSQRIASCRSSNVNVTESIGVPAAGGFCSFGSPLKYERVMPMLCGSSGTVARTNFAAEGSAAASATYATILASPSATSSGSGHVLLPAAPLSSMRVMQRRLPSTQTLLNANCFLAR